MTLRDLHFQNPNTFLYKKRGSLDFEPLGDLHFFGGLRPGFRGWGSYLRGLVSISVLYYTSTRSLVLNININARDALHRTYDTTYLMLDVPYALDAVSSQFTIDSTIRTWCTLQSVCEAKPICWTNFNCFLSLCYFGCSLGIGSGGPLNILIIRCQHTCFAERGK